MTYVYDLLFGVTSDKCVKMSNSTAQVLMKKGKRGAAAYIHADCASGSPQHLGPLLDVLLNPSKAIDEWETIDWCRWLLAGGRTPDEFAAVGKWDYYNSILIILYSYFVGYAKKTFYYVLPLLLSKIPQSYLLFLKFIFISGAVLCLPVIGSNCQKNFKC